MNYRPDLIALNSINGSIEHSVDEVGIGMAAYAPAHHHPIEAVDDRRQIDLARRDLELRNVGKPLLIWCRCLEVTIEKVVWRRADLS